MKKKQWMVSTTACLILGLIFETNCYSAVVDYQFGTELNGSPLVLKILGRNAAAAIYGSIDEKRVIKGKVLLFSAGLGKVAVGAIANLPLENLGP